MTGGGHLKVWAAGACALAATVGVVAVAPAGAKAAKKPHPTGACGGYTLPQSGDYGVPQLTQAAAFATCVVNDTVLVAEKDLPTLTADDLKACDAVQASGQALAWRAIDSLAKSVGKTEDLIMENNKTMKRVKQYFKDSAAYNSATLLGAVLKANNSFRAGVGYDEGHMYAALNAHKCSSASTAASDMAVDYPNAVTAANAFIAGVGPS